MGNPFEFVNAINLPEKPDIIRNGEVLEGDYVPFIVDRQFSMFADTVFYAGEMSKYSNLPNIAKFDYYRLSLRPKKRFAKWHKPSQDTDLELVKETYGFSTSKAATALKLLSESELSALRARMDKGGSGHGEHS